MSRTLPAGPAARGLPFPLPVSLPPPGPPPAPDGAGDPGVVVLPLPASPTGGALSRCEGRGMPFEWSLNPYRGCEFACGYCYARYTHAFLGLDDPLAFERRIFVKEGLPGALARDLDRRVLPGQRIALGTATDPYQPAERRHGVTRACLQVLARREGLRLSITTKSDLVVRDLDLLRVLASRGSLHVNFSVPTVDRRLARLLEPRAATPGRRLAALRTLAAEGIETGLFLMPVLPGLTDGPGALEETAAEAAAAGASYLCHQVAFLRDPTRSHFLGILRDRWPALLPRYRRWYAGGTRADPALREAVARRVARIRRRLRLADAPSDRAPPDPQLRLPFGPRAASRPA